MGPMTDTVNRRDGWTPTGTAGRCFTDERIQIFRSIFDASSQMAALWQPFGGRVGPGLADSRCT
jgi:hypothetical protein